MGKLRKAPNCALGTTPSQLPDVVCFGEILFDNLPDGPVLGGAPSNLAVAVHRLGVSVGLVSRVGPDQNGQKALDQLKLLGLPVNLIQIDEDKKTGLVDVKFGRDRTATYNILPDMAYDFIRADCPDDMLRIAVAARYFCFGTLIQRSMFSRSALETILHRRNGDNVCDINLRDGCYNKSSVRYSVRQADLLKMSREEAPKVCELLDIDNNNLRQVASDIGKIYHVKYVIITDGANGLYGYENGIGQRTTGFYLPGHKVKVVDTVGAGDNCTAAIVCSLLRGGSFLEACQLGNVIGALSTTVKGGMSSFKSGPARVRKMLQQVQVQEL